MPQIKPADLMFLEHLLDMEGGYVLNFSNRTFDDFVRGSTGEEIYSEQYEGRGDSKANRLRSFWAQAPDDKVAHLLADLLTLIIDNEMIPADGAEVARTRGIIDGLTTQATESVELARAPSVPEPPAQKRAFVSYAVEKKEAGGAVKRCLEQFGYDCFLAHEDLQVSEEWKHRILEELGAADVFIALLSEEFMSSKWCSQELGFIVSRPEVLVVPISLDGTTPYGFIAHLQGVRVTRSNLGSVLEEVMYRKRPRQMIAAQIERARGSVSWRGAEAAVLPLVPHFAALTDEEAEDFARAVAGNSEVWDAALCIREYIPEFARVAGSRISPEARNALLEVRPELEFPAA